MQLGELRYRLPCIRQADAVKMLTPRFATIDNWMRYEHIAPGRDEAGRRIFSFADMLTIEAAGMLTAIFKMPPTTAVKMANKAVAEFEPHFHREAGQVAAGGLEHGRRDTHLVYARDGEDVVELSANDERPDSVMLVLPTGTLARQLLTRVRDYGADVEADRSTAAAKVIA